MPRKYVPSKTKPYKKYDPEQMRAAIHEYENSRNKSLKEIGAKYNISKSVLHRHITRIMRPQGGQRALKLETEEYLIKNINICAEWGYPLDTYDLRILIKGYLDRVSIEVKRFKNNMPGPDFVECFLERHKQSISKRISQNVKRARAAVSPEIIEEYFTNLETSLDGVPLSNIINYDETNLSDDPGKKKIITKRGVKYPERVMNHSKSSTSLMIAASADGTLLPAYVVYKSVNIYPTWRQNGPRGCRYNRTKSGWFDGSTFENWVETIAMPYFQDKPGKKVLIGDNLSSHLSVELIQQCKEKDIYFVFLPANSTHLTQPLDVAFFRPMKTAWREILFNWKKTDGRTEASVPKHCFPRLLKKLFQALEVNQKNNILSGFSKTGISPINKAKVLERLPGNSIRNETCTDEEKKAIDEEIIKLLSEMRYGNATGAKRTSHIKKKLNVQPGKSVGEYSDPGSDVSDATSIINEQDSDEDIEDIESNIKTNLITLNKQNLRTTKKENQNRKTKKKQTKKMDQGNEKSITKKGNNKNKEEKSTSKEDVIGEIQIEEDNLDIQNMPIVFEDNFSVVDDTELMEIQNKWNLSSTLHDERQITPIEQVNEEDQSEVQINSKANNKSHVFKPPVPVEQSESKEQKVKAKGVGKKSRKQETDFKNVEETVKNTSDETHDDKIKEIKRESQEKQNFKGKSKDKKSKTQERYCKDGTGTSKNTSQINHCSNILTIKEERVYNSEANRENIIIKDQKKIVNEISGRKRKISIEVVKDAVKLKCQNSQQQEQDTFQENFNDENLNNVPIILEDTMTVSENVTIEYDNECKETFDTTDDGQAKRELKPKKCKLQILSNEPLKRKCRIKVSDTKKIPTNTIIKVSKKNSPKAGPSGIKKFYRNDAEIFKDLISDLDDED